MSNKGTKSGVELIREERERQVSEEGWTAEHDDFHGRGELAWAAVCYAAPEPVFEQKVSGKGVSFVDPWPWDGRFDKRPREPLGHRLASPTTEERIRMLAKAGALIAAEIDAIQREEAEIQEQKAGGLDAENVETLLLLVEHSIPRVTPRYGDGIDHALGENFPTLEEIDGWDQETRHKVYDWAAAVHMRASDNDDVEVPEVPEVLRG